MGIIFRNIPSPERAAIQQHRSMCINLKLICAHLPRYAYVTRRTIVFLSMSAIVHCAKESDRWRTPNFYSF